MVHSNTKTRHIRFYDTTLRDGEQMPGIAFSSEQQLAIATALDKLGVDEIEVGFAASGQQQQKDMARIAAAGLDARLLSLSRPLRSDIQAAKNSGVTGVILFTSLSDILLEHKLRKTYEQALRESCEAIQYAISLGFFVQLSFEDATRTSPERLMHASRAVVEAGAQRISVADTVGVAIPATMRAVVESVRAAVNVPIAAHCHNDFGLAVANALAAVEAGADVLSTTMLGIGERSGNASTEECALALHMLYGHTTSFKYELVMETAKLVADAAGVPIPGNKAIVGGNSFRHESGIHVAATLRHPLCYEPFDPALVGNKREIVLGKTSGRAALRHVANDLEILLDDDACRRVLDELKELAEAGRLGTIDEVRSLIQRHRSS